MKMIESMITEAVSKSINEMNEEQVRNLLTDWLVNRMDSQEY